MPHLHTDTGDLTARGRPPSRSCDVTALELDEDGTRTYLELGSLEQISGVVWGVRCIDEPVVPGEGWAVVYARRRGDGSLESGPVRTVVAACVSRVHRGCSRSVTDATAPG